MNEMQVRTGHAREVRLPVMQDDVLRLLQPREALATLKMTLEIGQYRVDLHLPGRERKINLVHLIEGALVPLLPALHQSGLAQLFLPLMKHHS